MSDFSRVDCVCRLDISEVKAKILSDFHFYLVIHEGNMLLLRNPKRSMEKINRELRANKSDYSLYGISLHVDRFHNIHEECETEFLIEEMGVSFLAGFITETLKHFEDIKKLNEKSAVMILTNSSDYEGKELTLHSAILTEKKVKYINFSSDKFNEEGHH